MFRIIYPTQQGRGRCHSSLEKRKGHFDTFPSNFVETDSPARETQAHICDQRTVNFLKRTRLCSYTNADLYSSKQYCRKAPLLEKLERNSQPSRGPLWQSGNESPVYEKEGGRRRAVAFCLSSLLSEEGTSGRHWNGEKKSVEGGEEDVEEEEEEESANISGFSGGGRSRWRRKCERLFPPFPSLYTDIYGK